MDLNHWALFLSNQEPYITVMFINLLKFFFKNMIMIVSTSYQSGACQNEPSLGDEAGSLLPIPSSSSICFNPWRFGSVNLLGDSSSGSGMPFFTIFLPEVTSHSRTVPSLHVPTEANLPSSLYPFKSLSQLRLEKSWYSDWFPSFAWCHRAKTN